MRQLTYRMCFIKCMHYTEILLSFCFAFLMTYMDQKDSHIHLHRSFASAAYRRSTHNWGIKQARYTKISAAVYVIFQNKFTKQASSQWLWKTVSLFNCLIYKPRQGNTGYKQSNAHRVSYKTEIRISIRNWKQTTAETILAKSLAIYLSVNFSANIASAIVNAFQYCYQLCRG